MQTLNLSRSLTQQPTRKTRTPVFPVAGVMKPFGLYPLYAQPVLPGETLQSFTMKWRNVSNPVKHPLAGSWLDVWLVYVKLTDLDENLGNMFISDSVSSTAFEADADRPRTFTKTGQIDWIKLCLEKIHTSYFIDEGETPRTIDGVPKVKVNNVAWYQNLTFEDTDVSVPTTDASDLYQHLNEYAMLQQMQMTELTYEKYLETYGVKLPSADQNKPEILRYARSWTQPVNTVDPVTGAPSSAWYWSDEVKMDKAKRFQEPGFVLAVASIRPKVFNKHVPYSMVGNLWGFSDWFPSYNLEDPTAGIKTIDAGTDKVLHADARTDLGSKNVLYDHRDLLSHGESFVNTQTEHIHDLPYYSGMILNDASTLPDLRGHYATDADVAALFTSAVAGSQFTYYEGICQARISGHITDTTR